MPSAPSLAAESSAACVSARLFFCAETSASSSAFAAASERERFFSEESAAVTAAISVSFDCEPPMIAPRAAVPSGSVGKPAGVNSQLPSKGLPAQIQIGIHLHMCVWALRGEPKSPLVTHVRREAT